MTIRVYLDNNATTRPHREVTAAMRSFEDELYLNASSVAGELLGAARPLAEARIALRALLGASDEDRIVFTSGATEANAWVFFATPPGGHIISSTIEHSSILAAVAAARGRGHAVDLVGVDRDGLIRSDELAAAVRPDTALVSLQFANNETGAIQPLAALARLIRQIAPNAIVHSDATQAVGRIPVDLEQELAEVDLLSFSAHKFHGPKGIGGLFLRSGIGLTPLIPGEQEGGCRGGTSNVPATAGLAVAARRAQHDLDTMQRVAALRDQLESSLSGGAEVTVNCVAVRRLPNTSSIVFAGLDAEHAVEQLALEGICIATGSACTAGATASSHVLTAMGLSDLAARSTLRFSLSSMTSREDIDTVAAALRPLLAGPAPVMPLSANG